MNSAQSINKIKIEKYMAYNMIFKIFFKASTTYK